MEHKIDATNQVFGRLASQIAILLRSKNNPNYQHNIMPNEKVTVVNVKKIKFTGKKLDQKIYYRYSGYPGGIKDNSLRTLFTKNPNKVLRSTIYHMLPKNKLRSKIIKNLIIE